MRPAACQCADQVTPEFSCQVSRLCLQFRVTMTSKYILWLCLAIVLTGTVVAQKENELQIPLENDNHFPPEKQQESDTVFEGSGQAVLEEPITTTTSSEPITTKESEDPTSTTEVAPILEEVQPQKALDDTKTAISNDPCPQPCVCSTEGDDFVVNCAGYGLSKFPPSLDSKTTKLYLQNNKLTNIPRQISQLKKLKELNAENNAIMELASGSISELPQLTLLNLRNNRLIEYPQDLKNSFGLTHLKEIDLGGNDMRTELTPEFFSNFNGLRKLTLPVSTTELVDNLCESLSLETVCTETCAVQSNDCLETLSDPSDDLEDAVLPGTLYTSEQNIDPLINPEDNSNAITERLEDLEVTNSGVNEGSIGSPDSNNRLNSRMFNEFSLRSEVDKVPSGNTQINSAVIPNDSNADVNVGATTSATSGGVDKSVIGIIVAGMVVIVAGITIKKNWTSIKKRFSSTPVRNVCEHTASNGNGTAPEEVPLKDKSPV